MSSATKGSTAKSTLRLSGARMPPRDPYTGKMSVSPCFVRLLIASSSAPTPHSADFLSCLIRQYPSEFAHFQHRATSYTTHLAGVTVHFAESARHPAQPDAEADVVVCSDGVKSLLRKEMYTKAGIELDRQEARYSKWIAWRGLVPVEAFTVAMGPNSSNKLMIVGKGKHILTFPVKKGKMINIVSSRHTDPCATWCRILCANQSSLP